MITADIKPIEEIAGAIAEYRKILIVACNSCVTVCLSGGERETEALASELSHVRYYKNKPPIIETKTFQRQCEQDLVSTYLEIPPETEAIVTLGCGAGAQTLAAVYTTIPIIPAVNTTFLGALDEPGVWREKCQGCGDCIITYTAGICPISRCSKSLLNGPCGGSSNGICEIADDVECAWQLILDRLKALGQLALYEKLFPMKDWSSDKYGGPRKLNRRIPPEED